jgi:hypothetical protein
MSETSSGVEGLGSSPKPAPQPDWSLSDLLGRYRKCLVRLETRADDSTGIGTAFHIGDGWLVSAAHNLRRRELVSALLDDEIRGGPGRQLTVKRVILSDSTADLALIETDFELSFYMDRTTIHGRPKGWKVDHIPIGGHLDDWLDGGLVMSRYVVMGYPQVPGTTARPLMADGGYVNAIVDPALREHPYFVVSGLPREGFSGGPVLSEYDFLLGVITDAFPVHEESIGLPMAAAISVEPLWSMLIDNDIYPGSNGDFVRYLKNHDEEALERWIGAAETPQSP